jgi:hypothetical protein
MMLRGRMLLLMQMNKQKIKTYFWQADLLYTA